MMSQQNIEFVEDVPYADRDADEILRLDIDGFDGPIDLLLNLAQTQKVDLREISILQLVDQYISYIESMKNLKIVIAADYLVMASWLAFLKSKLLLPQQENEEEPSGAAMAEALTFQLRRLKAMQELADKLWARPKLGVGIFARGNPEGLQMRFKSNFDISLVELLKAYGDIDQQKQAANYRIEEFQLMTVEQALERFQTMLGKIKSWTVLSHFYTEAGISPLYNRSVVASVFSASLELAKDGRVELRQDKPFGDIYLKGKAA